MSEARKLPEMSREEADMNFAEDMMQEVINNKAIEIDATDMAHDILHILKTSPHYQVDIKEAARAAKAMAAVQAIAIAREGLHYVCRNIPSDQISYAVKIYAYHCRPTIAAWATRKILAELLKWWKPEGIEDLGPMYVPLLHMKTVEELKNMTLSQRLLSIAGEVMAREWACQLA